MVQAQTVDMPTALSTSPNTDAGFLGNSNRSDKASSSYSSGYGGRDWSGRENGRASEQETPAADALPGGWPATPNGVTPATTAAGSVKEGTGGGDGSILSVPNGDARSERASSARSATLSLRSRKSGGYESVERQSIEVATVKETSARPGAAEEGYFALPSNGKPVGPAKNAIPSGIGMVNGSAAAPPTKEKYVPVPMTPNSALPPVEETSPPQPQTQLLATDGMLKPPHAQHHRASSPPAFERGSSPSTAQSSSTSPPQSARPDRLTHRHTLEVPKVNTRTSRDDPNHVPPTSQGVASATGRFSPTTPQKRRGSMQLARRVTHSLHSYSDMYLDEVPQDEDAARWTEHIKAKRASKKARVDTDDDRVVVGTKVDQHHVNWVTAYNMLTGIRFVVSRTNAKLDRDLTDADFDAKHKFSFDITGNELTPSAKYDFKFKDYAPWVFRHLRSRFGLDPADYLVSLTSKYILSELGSPGKSGSFFYFSRDYKYIIKTIHHAEHKFLRKVLRDYYNHVADNPNTLLSQFYGLHRVKMPLGRKIHFVVMNNLFPANRDIHRTFDLKGSTIGRDFREEDLEKNPRATLKDLNWLRRNLHLEFGPTKKEAFVAQMQRDVALLQKLKIMDYSLLVGIHDLERGNEENLRDKTLTVFQPGGHMKEEPQMGTLVRTPSKMEASKRARELRDHLRKERPKPIGQDLDQMSEGVKKGLYFYADDGGFRATHENDRPGEEIYYLGIIDCLTRYGLVKKAEHFWKGMGGKESQISPIPPDRYGDRFVKFISGITKSRERAELERQSQSFEQTIGMHVPPGIEGTVDDPQLGGINLSKNRVSAERDAFDPPGTEMVIANAERQAQRSLEKGRSELEVPDRALTAVRTPDPADPDGIMLPVIGEAVESGSNASRTPSRVSPKPSREDVAAGLPILGDANMPSESLGEVPPPTPPKTDDSVDMGRASWGGGPPPTPPKDEKRVSRLDKELPVLPRVSLQYSQSPQRAADSELEMARARGR